MEDCIFCQIRDGKTDQKRLYQDDMCFVIADKYPLTKGHILIVSKEHYRDITEVPDEIVSHIFVKARDLSKVLMEGFGADGINIGANTGSSAGQKIFHFHVHVVPRYPGQGRSGRGYWERVDQVVSAKEIEELERLLGTKSGEV